MTLIGYTMLCEQAGPKQLVRDVALAAGFTHVALVQIGADTQKSFIAWTATQLLPALRTA